MQMKTLLGERIVVLPDISEGKTESGLIIPDQVKTGNNNLKEGVVTKKGTGTPWNPMDDVHVKQRVRFKRGAGIPYEETEDGITSQYLILSYHDLLLV